MYNRSYVSRCLKPQGAAACQKLRCRMQIFRCYTSRANYEEITHGSTDEYGDEIHASSSPCEKRDRACMYTRGKFDFVVGLQYSIISWVDRGETSAVENPPYPGADIIFHRRRLVTSLGDAG